MGNQIKPAIINGNFGNKKWQTVHTNSIKYSGNPTVVATIDNEIIADEYLIEIDETLNIQMHKKIYEDRASSNSGNLVNIYSAEIIGDEFSWLPTKSKLRVRAQWIPWRLNTHSNLSIEQGLYILQYALIGFYEISQYYKQPYCINANMIGINQLGRVKIWLNDNFAKNIPNEEKFQLENFKQMFIDVVRVVEEKLQCKKFPLSLKNNFARVNDLSSGIYQITNFFNRSKQTKVQIGKNLIQKFKLHRTENKSSKITEQSLNKTEQSQSQSQSKQQNHNLNNSSHIPQQKYKSSLTIESKQISMLTSPPRQIKMLSNSQILPVQQSKTSPKKNQLNKHGRIVVTPDIKQNSAELANKNIRSFEMNNINRMNNNVNLSQHNKIHSQRKFLSKSSINQNDDSKQNNRHKQQHLKQPQKSVINSKSSINIANEKPIIKNKNSSITFTNTSEPANPLEISKIFMNKHHQNNNNRMPTHQPNTPSSKIHQKQPNRNLQLSKVVSYSQQKKMTKQSIVSTPKTLAFNQSNNNKKLGTSETQSFTNYLKSYEAKQDIHMKAIQNLDVISNNLKNVTRHVNISQQPHKKKQLPWRKQQTKKNQINSCNMKQINQQKQQQKFTSMQNKSQNNNRVQTNHQFNKSINKDIEINDTRKYPQMVNKTYINEITNKIYQLDNKNCLLPQNTLQKSNIKAFNTNYL